MSQSYKPRIINQPNHGNIATLGKVKLPKGGFEIEVAYRLSPQDRNNSIVLGKMGGFIHLAKEKLQEDPKWDPEIMLICLEERSVKRDGFEFQEFHAQQIQETATKFILDTGKTICLGPEPEIAPVPVAARATVKIDTSAYYTPAPMTEERKKKLDDNVASILESVSRRMVYEWPKAEVAHNKSRQKNHKNTQWDLEDDSE